MNWKQMQQELAKEGLRIHRPKGSEEDELQKSCIRWWDCHFTALKMLLHHSPNEGRLVGGRVEGGKRKQMGVRAGFPDLVLMCPNSHYHYLCVELKTKKGRQSAAQKDYQKLVEKAGGRYAVVRSLEEFKSEIIAYVQHIDVMPWDG